MTQLELIQSFLELSNLCKAYSNSSGSGSNFETLATELKSCAQYLELNKNYQTSEKKNNGFYQLILSNGTTSNTDDKYPSILNLTYTINGQLIQSVGIDMSPLSQ